MDWDKKARELYENDPRAQTIYLAGAREMAKVAALMLSERGNLIAASKVLNAAPAAPKGETT